MPKFLLLVSLCLYACRTEKPLVIHIFYDPTGAFVASGLERKTWDFNITANKTLNGRSLIVANLGTNDYQKTLKDVVPRVKPDLLIFNSVTEAQQFGSGVNPDEAINLCAPNATCLAVIPTWVEGERRLATAELRKYIQER
jgi:hypothetical protein